MKHTVHYFKGEQEVGSEEIDGPFTDSQAYAIDSVGRGDYDRVDIKDSNGKLLFSRPRAVSPSAPPDK